MAQIFVGSILLVSSAICFFGWGLAEEQKAPDKGLRLSKSGKQLFLLGVLLMFGGALLIGHHN